MKPHKLSLLFALLLMLLVGVSAVAAQEIPCVIIECFTTPCPQPVCPVPIGGVATNPSTLVVTHHFVDVRVENQIARTSVSMEFRNDGEQLAEGTFIFPLPAGASVDQLTMYINDEPFEASILGADEARAVYDEIVRRYRDPALLEYLGTGAIQANVFPIPPGDKRRIEITYSQVLEADNGLIHYVYPLDVTSLTSNRPIEQMRVRVEVLGDTPISTVYSPSHNIGISRTADEDGFTASFESNDFIADQDFSLYYGISSDRISANLLTYREGANTDGFFMLLVQPPLTLPDEQIAARNVILVVDQSGSMDGDKWTQAQSAARYVLENLREDDRFNVVMFSTGVRTFSNELESASVAGEAADWIDGSFPEGGTNINDALLTALDQADPARETTILFITDGLPTEGEMNPDSILSNLGDADVNARIFTFGVGDDVDTYLLDQIADEFHGDSSYVRPTERIDEEVASLYNKISAPVLTNVQLAIDGVTIDTLYPENLGDLFAGTQLTVVGRYRGDAANATITLSGEVNGEEQTYVYDGQQFRERAGGEGFIAQLWATRRIGDLLNRIRLEGENSEWVDSIVSLSVRYGIITPYTSFLITEDDILSQQAQREAADTFAANTNEAFAQSSGAAAVGAADMAGNLAEASAPMPAATMSNTLTDEEIAAGVVAAPNPIQTVDGKTFLLQNGVWTDTAFDPDTMTTAKVTFLSDEYFALLEAHPELGSYLALGEQVIVVLEDGTAVESVSSEQ